MNQSATPRIVLAGSVSSSRRSLAALLRHRADVRGVLELTEELAPQVSGFARLADLADNAGVPCVKFRNINAPEVIEQVRSWRPDLLFVVGLSQLVRPELLAVPTRGCIGFHPTQLPKGRGRAPVAWLTLDGAPGAATFFLMDDGADSGPIMVQEPFDVTREDYAADVIRKAEEALDRALERWLPALLRGEWNPQPQDDRLATYHGKRASEDGMIDWREPAERVQALIRAASRPHPGAYTHARRRKLIVWRAEVDRITPFRGVPGRILHIDKERGALVQCGEGLLWLMEVEWPGDLPAGRLNVGLKLGVDLEDEVVRLQDEIESLRERIAQLEAQWHPAGAQS